MKHQNNIEIGKCISYRRYHEMFLILTKCSYQVTIKSAAGLPPSLSHYVFCQYMFWGDTDITVVPPTVQPSYHHTSSNGSGSSHFHASSTMLTVHILSQQRDSNPREI